MRQLIQNINQVNREFKEEELVIVQFGGKFRVSSAIKKYKSSEKEKLLLKTREYSVGIV